MGKYKWHVERKEVPARLNKYGAKITRTFNHITKLYDFILRNPRMFKDYTLQLYLHEKPMVEASFKDIKYRRSLNEKERIERLNIIETKKLYDKYRKENNYV